MSLSLSMEPIEGGLASIDMKEVEPAGEFCSWSKSSYKPKSSLPWTDPAGEITEGGFASFPNKDSAESSNTTSSVDTAKAKPSNETLSETDGRSTCLEEKDDADPGACTSLEANDMPSSDCKEGACTSLEAKDKPSPTGTSSSCEGVASGISFKPVSGVTSDDACCCSFDAKETSVGCLGLTCAHACLVLELSVRSRDGKGSGCSCSKSTLSNENTRCTTASLSSSRSSVKQLEASSDLMACKPRCCCLANSESRDRLGPFFQARGGDCMVASACKATFCLLSNEFVVEMDED
mmetsp:Transcript_31005/g.74618  ORF Transcript_31005/g.74618 Transcript_31005/m.74618 type:complete len:293 (+) Transcript_31005:3426-4304(+)